MLKIELQTNPTRLIIIAENVNICEDVEDIKFFFTKDNKIDFSKKPNIDIKDNVLDMFCEILEKLIDERKKCYNSLDVMQSLYEKLNIENKITFEKTINNKK